MALSDSMFLFEIAIEELKSYFSPNDYSIYSQFADVFQVYLKNPNEMRTSTTIRSNKKLTKKSKVRDTKTAKTSKISEALLKQSVLIAYNSDILEDKMRKYPLELSLRSKYNPEVILASNQIPWCDTFINYLNETDLKNRIDPATVEKKYSVFHEYTSKRVATIKLNIKLSCLKDKLYTQFQCPYTSNFIPPTILSTIKERELADEIGIIRTKYAGGKTKLKRSNGSSPHTETSDTFIMENKNEISDIKYIEFEKNDTSRNKIVSLVKSDTDIEVRQKPSLVKTQSCCTLEYAKHLNTLNYIFGDSSGPFGNRVYCVGYFTVHNDSVKKLASPKDSNKDGISSQSSADGKEKHNINLCDDKCIHKKASVYGSPSQYSLDLPKDGARLISVKRCDRVDCHAAKNREPPSLPDERLMVDLTSMKRDSCIISEKVEQVVGGMTAKMKMGERPCYCSCECTFGFTKKTTYCNICGGVEKFGEEKLGPLAFPCPIYHKLVDKTKLKTVSSGSDSRKKGLKHTSPPIDKNDESEKDNKKGKKKKKDDRFKFNYGYTGIPPQIGHSQCAMPCTGTLGAVPKNMGWLWTAEDVPGMRIANGWKPGAISKRLLRKLKKARRQTYAVESSKPTKRQRKRTENKPTLIVCKVNGEYRVEMQTTPENNEGNNEQYTPLVYKIAKANNKDKLAKLELKKRRLVKEIIGNFKDPYHADICEQTCLKAYKQAIGLLPYDPNNPECPCEDVERADSSQSCYCEYDEVSSECSSMDIDWEIHFSPPIASHS